MLEYPVDEAVALLNKKLQSARDVLVSVESDLDFLNEQKTSVELSLLQRHHHLFLIILSPPSGCFSQRCSFILAFIL